MDARKYLPSRSKDSHKGNFGHVLIVGGDYGMAGACRLAGEAALRSGAGLVSVATRSEHAYAMAGACPELMCHGIVKAMDLDNLLTRATVVAIGSGLGQGVWGRTLFNHVLKTDLPLVVDADALNLLALKHHRRSNWILTPHPGEAGRLLDCSAQEIQQDRPAAIQKLQAQYHGVIVLKGAGGNPAMATAGMGDVLTGVIAALVAQKLSLEDAATLGVWVHTTAGEKAAQGFERGLIARDLMLGIRELLNPKPHP